MKAILRSTYRVAARSVYVLSTLLTRAILLSVLVVVLSFSMMLVIFFLIPYKQTSKLLSEEADTERSTFWLRVTGSPTLRHWREHNLTQSSRSDALYPQI
jgi:hypothetical protein